MTTSTRPPLAAVDDHDAAVTRLAKQWLDRTDPHVVSGPLMHADGVGCLACDAIRLVRLHRTGNEAAAARLSAA